MPRSVYSKIQLVEKSHLDGLNHVNNVVYVQWIQDIAGAHWLSHAPEEIKEKVLWVVRRHEIDYKLPCFAGESLSIKTETPKEFKGPLWDRYVWIYKPDGKLAVSATTTWCLLDHSTGRPLRISPEILNVFIENE
jgi:acyl-CoA thioester hydrolase